MWCHYWNSHVLSCSDNYVDLHQPLNYVAHETKTLFFARKYNALSIYVCGPTVAHVELQVKHKIEWKLPLKECLPLNCARMQLEPIFQHFCGMPPAPILHLRMVFLYSPPPSPPPALVLVCMRTSEWLSGRHMANHPRIDTYRRTDFGLPCLRPMLIVQQNGAKSKMVCAFNHTSMKFCTKVLLDVLFHIWVKGKLSFSNVAAKSKMVAINRFKDKNSINSCMHQ